MTNQGRPLMDEHRFDVLLTVVLLAGGVWYGVRMLLYPSGAGRVPAFVAAIFVTATLVQLALLLLRRRRPAPASVDAGGPATSADGPAEPRAEQEPEMDTFETLIALTPERRRKFVAIAAFSVLFYVGAMLVGFVITTAVLITAILLVARERAYVAVIGGVLGGAAAYALTVGIMNMPALDGILFS